MYNFFNLVLAGLLALPLIVAGHVIPAEARNELAIRAEGDVVLHKRFSNSKWTWYDTETGNAGACGRYLRNYQYVVAMNVHQYNRGDCFKTITLSWGGKTAQAVIEDMCPSCPYGGLDLSPSLFAHFADHGVGVIWDGVWNWGAGAPPPPPPPTTTWRPPTTTWTPPPPTTTWTPPRPTTTWTPPRPTTTWTPPRPTTTWTPPPPTTTWTPPRPTTTWTPPRPTTTWTPPAPTTTWTPPPQPTTTSPSPRPTTTTPETTQRAIPTTTAVPSSSTEASSEAVSASESASGTARPTGADVEEAIANIASTNRLLVLFGNLVAAAGAARA